MSTIVIFNNSSTFYAYHTKIDLGESLEEQSRTGQHTDLFVQLIVWIMIESSDAIEFGFQKKNI